MKPSSVQDAHEIEERIARRFLMTGAAQRAIALINSRKQSDDRRRKLVDIMIDIRRFKPDLCRIYEEPPTTAKVLHALSLHCDTPVYVISESDLDRRWAPAGVTLDEILRSGFATLMYNERGVSFLEIEEEERFLICDE